MQVAACLRICNTCITFLVGSFLPCIAIRRTCRGSDDPWDCAGKGDWIWELSSKQRSFDDIDDPSQSWRTCFRESAAQIHAEFLAFERNHSFEEIVGDYGGDTSRDPSGKKWHQLALQLWSSESPEMEAFFPVLTSCLHQSPLTALLFSIIDPWSEISPHTGLTYTILRYHLNLELPQYDPEKDRELPQYGAKQCGKKSMFLEGDLEPGDTCFQAPVHLGVYDAPMEHVKYFEWKKYDDLVFDDMHLHFVQNQTPERRVVIWGDIPRYDLPWYARIVVEIMHVVVPPMMPEARDAIDHASESLRHHAGVKNHFVRRYFGLSLKCLKHISGRITFVCIIFLSAAFCLKQRIVGIWRRRRAGMVSMKEV